MPQYIKHLAIAVQDLDKAVEAYRKFLGVTGEIKFHDMARAQSREAHFFVGDVQIQLCQSTVPDGRFAEFIKRRGGEGLHHICWAVENIDEALKNALRNGATLKECRPHGVKGSHKHSEGWVAFLEDEVSGIEVEFMQVYKPGEGPDTQKRDV